MMKLNDRWFDIRPHCSHDQIEKAYHSDARFMFLRCGRRAWKSEIMKRRLVRSLASRSKYGNGRYFFSAPTQKQAKKVAWNDLLALTPTAWVSNINRTELVIETVFGSTLEIAGLDQPQRLEGVGYDGGAVDESADVKPSAIAISIMPALADRKGFLMRGGVPKRTGRGARDYNRAFDYVHRHGKIQGTEYKAEAYSWMSKASLDPDELTVQKALLDPKDYREQFEASIETAGGGIFHSWGSDNIKACDYDPSRPIIIGMDYNVSPMCWVLCHEIDGVIYVFDELWRMDTHTQECLDRIVMKYGHHDQGKKHQSGFWVYGDATGKSRNSATPVTNHIVIANEKRLHGLRMLFPKANPSVHDRFASMNRMLRDANGKVRLFVDPRCKHLIEDIEMDCYKPGTTTRDESDKNRGHMNDALGYICHSRHPIRTDYSGGESGVGIVNGNG